MSNPKFMAKAFYYGVCIFGAFHVTRMSVALMTSAFLARFGRPSLVRETSKISTGNYFALPYLYGRRFVQKSMAMSEKNLLDGVILEKKLED
jgi:hypothetical protein